VTLGTPVGTQTGSGIFVMILSSDDLYNPPAGHAEHVPFNVPIYATGAV